MICEEPSSLCESMLRYLSEHPLPDILDELEDRVVELQREFNKHRRSERSDAVSVAHARAALQAVLPQGQDLDTTTYFQCIQDLAAAGRGDCSGIGFGEFVCLYAYFVDLASRASTAHEEACTTPRTLPDIRQTSGAAGHRLRSRSSDADSMGGDLNALRRMRIAHFEHLQRSALPPLGTGTGIHRGRKTHMTKGSPRASSPKEPPIDSSFDPSAAAHTLSAHCRVLAFWRRMARLRRSKLTAAFSEADINRLPSLPPSAH